ncbi:hypothetical protein [Brevibacillus sp. NRS-1366]|uniref:hypothetical protein n=1 Tax=Brevibacillus sp. NRS-1366 TaxID=3233899 RepID=UPI003D20A82C
MNKKVNIVQGKRLSEFNSIDEYLTYAYGVKKLEQSKVNSDPTFLDVIGYTLDECGFETVEEKTYDLEEIEAMMINIEEDEDKKDLGEI